MIDYLSKYNVDINSIKTRFNKDIINKFDIMEQTVINNLDFLQTIGIENYTKLITTRPDLCFSNPDIFKEKINKFDVNLIKYIIENDPENLINFDI